MKNLFVSWILIIFLTIFWLPAETVQAQESNEICLISDFGYVSKPFEVVYWLPLNPRILPSVTSEPISDRKDDLDELFAQSPTFTPENTPYTGGSLSQILESVGEAIAGERENNPALTGEGGLAGTTLPETDTGRLVPANPATLQTEPREARVTLTMRWAFAKGLPSRIRLEPAGDAKVERPDDVSPDEIQKLAGLFVAQSNVLNNWEGKLTYFQARNIILGGGVGISFPNTISDIVLKNQPTQPILPAECRGVYRLQIDISQSEIGIQEIQSRIARLNKFIKDSRKKRGWYGKLFDSSEINQAEKSLLRDKALLESAKSDRQRMLTALASREKRIKRDEREVEVAKIKSDPDQLQKENDKRVRELLLAGRETAKIGWQILEGEKLYAQKKAFLDAIVNEHPRLSGEPMPETHPLFKLRTHLIQSRATWRQGMERIRASRLKDESRQVRRNIQDDIGPNVLASDYLVRQGRSVFELLSAEERQAAKGIAQRRVITDFENMNGAQFQDIQWASFIANSVIDDLKNPKVIAKRLAYLGYGGGKAVVEFLPGLVTLAVGAADLAGESFDKTMSIVLDREIRLLGQAGSNKFEKMVKATLYLDKNGVGKLNAALLRKIATLSAQGETGYQKVAEGIGFGTASILSFDAFAMGKVFRAGAILKSRALIKLEKSTPNAPKLEVLPDGTPTGTGAIESNSANLNQAPDTPTLVPDSNSSIARSPAEAVSSPKTQEVAREPSAPEPSGSQEMALLETEVAKTPIARDANAKTAARDPNATQDVPPRDLEATQDVPPRDPDSTQDASPRDPESTQDVPPRDLDSTQNNDLRNTETPQTPSRPNPEAESTLRAQNTTQNVPPPEPAALQRDLDADSTLRAQNTTQDVPPPRIESLREPSSEPFSPQINPDELAALPRPRNGRSASAQPQQAVDTPLTLTRTAEPGAVLTLPESGSVPGRIVPSRSAEQSATLTLPEVTPVPQRSAPEQSSTLTLNAPQNAPRQRSPDRPNLRDPQSSALPKEPAALDNSASPDFQSRKTEALTDSFFKDRPSALPRNQDGSVPPLVPKPFRLEPANAVPYQAKAGSPEVRVIKRSKRSDRFELTPNAKFNDILVGDRIGGGGNTTVYRNLSDDATVIKSVSLGSSDKFSNTERLVKAGRNVRDQEAGYKLLTALEKSPANDGLFRVAKRTNGPTIVRAELNGKQQFFAVTIEENIAQTVSKADKSDITVTSAFERLAAQGRNSLNEAEQITLNLALRRLNDEGIFWTDQKLSNFDIVPSDKSPTGYQMVFFDFDAFRFALGSTRKARFENARDVQKYFDNMVEHYNNTQFFLRMGSKFERRSPGSGEVFDNSAFGNEDFGVLYSLNANSGRQDFLEMNKLNADGFLAKLEKFTGPGGREVTRRVPTD